MGSTIKADSERRELVRERRQARLERKQQRRDARERKLSQIAGPSLSAIQHAAQEHVDAAVDRIVSEALERHDKTTAIASARHPASVSSRPTDTTGAPSPTAPGADRTQPPAGSLSTDATGRPRLANEATPVAREGERRPRRERDIAAFRERRRLAADEARAEARERIARAGEPACVADALAALAQPEARPWESEREQLERALETGRIADVGAVARRAVWSISRDAARTSHRATRDPDLAAAACVAYAIIARLPRTALRSAQRTLPAPEPRRSRPFWR